jgi:hypothetical protein
VTRREKRKFRRAEQSLRWWLCHYADCHMCRFDEDLRFSRESVALLAADDYRSKIRRPVRVPRRFWHVLGREVRP